MSSEKSISRFPIPLQQNLQNLSLAILCKSTAIFGLLLFFFYMLMFNNPNNNPSTNRFSLFQLKSLSYNDTFPPSLLGDTKATNFSHIVFGIVASMNTWKHKKSYVEAWWRPNTTRGYVFLDRSPSIEFQPWPSSFPPFRINEDTTKYKVYPKRLTPVQVRIVRTILETVREGDKGVRWYVMADDDTVFFIDNLVEVLAKYDHTKYLYIGMNSECVRANADLSFDMAFGGAGYALSYPLAKTLAGMIDGCIERYPHLFSSDYILQACLADIGVPLIHERGFHQIDLHGDISGLLSAHPQSPVLSLHHIDTIDSIFPSMNRSASITHLMKSAKIDHSRILQQTICYDRNKNWTFSVSWGYSTHIYENVLPRSLLRRPIETFKPWIRSYKPPFYMFNTRWINKGGACEAPHVFFMESVQTTTRGNQVVTTYVRGFPRNLPPCLSSGNFSAEPISKVRVFSPGKALKEVGVMECCDVEQTTELNVTHIKLRTCRKGEIIA